MTDKDEIEDLKKRVVELEHTVNDLAARVVLKLTARVTELEKKLTKD